MSGLYKTFGTSKALEQDGIIVDYDEVRIKIARAGGNNQKFKDRLSKLLKSRRHAIENDTIGEAEQTKLQAQVYAETILLGWWTQQFDKDGTPLRDDNGELVYKSYILDDEGNELEFSRENVVETLIRLPDWFADIRTMAGTAANFRKDEEDEDEKNFNAS